MHTILVIDTQPPHVATEALGDIPHIVMVVDDLVRARHVLRNMRVDLWMCDLTVEGLNFRALRHEASTLNGGAAVIVTGESVSQLHASTLIKQGQADRFVVKPWQPMALKSAIYSLLEQGGRSGAPASGGAGGKGTAGTGMVGGSSAKRVITIGKRPQVLVKPRPGAAAAAAEIASDGRYRLDELVGVGGMGRIYRARDTLLDMEVAVKLLNQEFSRDEDAIATLKEETRLCMRLLHKHVVRVYNLERRHDHFMIIMEYVKGFSLTQYLAQMPQGLPTDFVMQIIPIMGGALSYSHRKGVLHKDISPGNILISGDGVLKLIDFGIADRVNRQKSGSEYIVGTPVYMSPEQLRGDTLDVRADVYSFGMLTCQMLTGELPVAAGVNFDALADEPHPAITGLPPNVAQVLEVATAFDRAERWATVDNFVSAFIDACRIDYPPVEEPAADATADANGDIYEANGDTYEEADVQDSDDGAPRKGDAMNEEQAMSLKNEPNQGI